MICTSALDLEHFPACISEIQRGIMRIKVYHECTNTEINVHYHKYSCIAFTNKLLKKCSLFQNHVRMFTASGATKQANRDLM